MSSWRCSPRPTALGAHLGGAWRGNFRGACIVRGRFPWISALRGCVALPDDAQAFECQELVNPLDVPRCGCDQCRLPAGGNHAGLVPENALHTIENAIDQIRVSVE